MAKKPADRKAVIDDIRRKQKAAEKRSSYAIVGVCVAVAVLIIAAAAYRPVKDWWSLREFKGLDLSSIGAPASVCGDRVFRVPTGASASGTDGSHVPEGAEVDYEFAPPIFGPHWNVGGVAPVPMDRKFYTAEDRPPLEALVHNSEHGYAILWYDETIADDADALTEVRALAQKFPGTSNLRYKFKAVPWLSTDEDGAAFPDGMHVALTHWAANDVVGFDDRKEGEQTGIWQYCSEVSGDALKQFMIDYDYLNSPEPNAM
ncbi:MAG: DUF3105 domain-containing protein [Nocardioides sp.]